MKVVPVDDEIVVFTSGRVAGTRVVRLNRLVWNREMVGVDMLFSFEIECGHAEIPRSRCGCVSSSYVKLCGECLFPERVRGIACNWQCIMHTFHALTNRRLCQV